MNSSMHVKIRPDGVAEFLAIDYESHPITVWYEDKDYMVFKIPAGKHWESILANSVSHPGQYLVTRKEEAGWQPPYAQPENRYYLVTELFSMPLSSRGRQAGP